MFYDKTVDPSISLIFAGAASKFVHSMMPNSVGGIAMSENFYNPAFLVKNGICPVLSSLDNPAESPDIYYSDELRDQYLGNIGLSTDRGAIDIQTGRDLGLPCV